MDLLDIQTGSGAEYILKLDPDPTRHPDPAASETLYIQYLPDNVLVLVYPGLELLEEGLDLRPGREVVI